MINNNTLTIASIPEIRLITNNNKILKSFAVVVNILLDNTIHNMILTIELISKLSTILACILDSLPVIIVLTLNTFSLVNKAIPPIYYRKLLQSLLLIKVMLLCTL